MTIDTNELRRLAQAATPGPWKLLPVGDKSKCFAVADINFLSVLTVVDECGTSFGAVYLDGDAKFIAAANPATVSELLDRLEEAEADALEQARLNGMGASREAALMAKLEAAEKERDALQAKVEEMEKQEPVARFNWSKGELEWLRPWNYRTMDKKPLYLAPGAKGEEK